MRLGFGEILVILALALLFFGPFETAQLGASLGQAIRGFKKPERVRQGRDAEAAAFSAVRMYN